MKKAGFVFLITGISLFLFVCCANQAVRPSKSANAKLASLTVSVGTLVPAFDPNLTDYSVNVGQSTASVTIAATPADADASVSLPSAGLSPCSNAKTVVVTAADGQTALSYQVKIWRSPFVMVSVPAGSFRRDTVVANVSQVSAYRMSSTEVTCEAYMAVTGLPNPSNPLFSTGEPNTPVQYVEWQEAIAFCNRLSVIEGLTPVYSASGQKDPSKWAIDAYMSMSQDASANGYRLPTEMQWKWAAMGADTLNPGLQNSIGYQKIFSGYVDSSTDPDQYLWYWDNSGGKCHPVGSKKPNELGIYDLSGNVSEWCWDFCNGGNSSGLLVDYQGTSVPDSNYSRKKCGGSYISSDTHYEILSSNSGDYLRQVYIGFRVVLPQ